jgi:CRISPR type III-B/RAMP module-associated protein Cmr3
MNIIHLSPTDILFFKDGRPMEASAAGHGAAWPLPHIVNAAFHAALHRADIEAVHTHRSGRSSQRDTEADRDRKFGSLVTTGPFPVSPSGQWYFPRPADAQIAGSPTPSLLPLQSNNSQFSSLHAGLLPVVNTCPPTKEKPEKWFSQDAWAQYLASNKTEGESLPSPHFLNDSDLSETEHQIGIGINPESSTTETGKFYSAQYLRLHPNWKLGVTAEATDKINGSRQEKRDLIRDLLDSEGHLLIGGQQRNCTAQRIDSQALPFPHASQVQGTHVKWTLLTPAIFPQIDTHPGGWLPSWITADTLEVQLLDGPGKNKARRMKCAPGKPIQAKLVAAIVSGSQAVTGFATGEAAGAKSTHLAVPAGSVYYFEADDSEQAQKLADALNWHGRSTALTQNIVNRRSTLFGEKGFGLGLCSNWTPLV